MTRRFQTSPYLHYNTAADSHAHWIMDDRGISKDVIDKDLVEDEEYVIGPSETGKRASGDDMDVTIQVSKS